MKSAARYLVLSIAVMTAGCDVPIELDLAQTPPQVSIEAVLTDKAGKQFVRVTTSVDFYYEGAVSQVTDASVTLRDDVGEFVSFARYAGANADSAAYYLPPVGYVGTVGRIYTLTVSAAGKTFQASDTLRRVTTIDSLSYRPNIYAEADPPPSGKIYELLVYAKEPQDTKDYYLVKYYRNDSLTYRGSTDVYVLNDYGIGENIDGIPSDVHYALLDTAGIEMYSLSRDGFLFYNDLATILNSDGGMFSPPPANPRTNFSGGALGFFQVSAVNSKEIVLHE